MIYYNMTVNLITTICIIDKTTAEKCKTFSAGIPSGMYSNNLITAEKLSNTEYYYYRTSSGQTTYGAHWKSSDLIIIFKQEDDRNASIKRRLRMSSPSNKRMP